MSDKDRRSRALAAAASASGAAAELIRFAREGDLYAHSAFGETVEQLLDAARMAIEIETAKDDDREQIAAAIAKYLEGWA